MSGQPGHDDAFDRQRSADSTGNGSIRNNSVQRNNAVYSAGRPGFTGVSTPASAPLAGQSDQSGQPGSDQPGQPGSDQPGQVGSDQPGQVGGDQPGQDGEAGPGGQPDHERVTGQGRLWRGKARSDYWHRKPGALLPGAWAQSTAASTAATAGSDAATGSDVGTSAASGTDSTDPAAASGASPAGGSGGGSPRTWRRPGSWGLTRSGAARTAGRWIGGLRGGRLALAVGAVALACTMLGGVIGGYVALSSDTQPTTNPSYSLGTVPPALTNRPASSVAGIAARVTPSVVMIKVNGGVGTGSGFIIPGNYIVTDNHVVTLDGELSNAALRVYFSNGRSAPGVLVGRDPYSDIAVIKAEGVGSLPALSMGNSAGVDVGDPVIAVGSPLGLADTVTSGIVSAINRPVQPDEAGSTPQVYFDAIQTDAPINPGNSGGPLVNAKGQVIGVDAAIDTLNSNPLTGGQGGSIGLGFAIPINQARRVAVELIRTGHATHAVIGADINVGWGGNGAEIASTRPGGAATVTPGGPAAAAGLQPGDVITKFDGQTINDADTLLDAIRSLPPGAREGLTYVKDGQTYTGTIQLGSASS
jgi:putative serine protease PepD